MPKDTCRLLPPILSDASENLSPQRNYVDCILGLRRSQKAKPAGLALFLLRDFPFSSR